MSGFVHEGIRKQERTLSTSARGDLRVLVVDAQPHDRTSAARALRGRGYEVATVSAPTRGLAMVEYYRPDLVLLDPGSERGEVMQLVRRLRSRPSTSLVPFVFLGPRAEIADLLRGYTLGADVFLDKPVDGDDLVGRVATAIHRAGRATDGLFRPRPTRDPTVSELLAGFRGDLEELGLPTLLSLLAVEQKTGTLTVVLKPDDLKVRLYLRAGSVVQARLALLDRPRDKPLILSVLGRCKGTFRFQAGPVDLEDRIHCSIAGLLLEGARRVDERSSNGRGLRDPDGS